jgi:hypothetical protein
MKKNKEESNRLLCLKGEENFFYLQQCQSLIVSYIIYVKSLTIYTFRIPI